MQICLQVNCCEAQNECIWQGAEVQSLQLRLVNAGLLVNLDRKLTFLCGLGVTHGPAHILCV